MPHAHQEKKVHRTLKLGLKGADVRELQQGINAAFDHYKIDYGTRVDADYGHHSKKAALLCLFVIGASNKLRHRTRHEGMPERAQVLIRNPRKRSPFMAIRRAHRRRKIRLLRRKSHQPEAGGPKGAELGSWDGRSVAGWMVGTRPGPDGKTVNWLQKIKDAGTGWGGHLWSGFRTPAESQAACFGICGRPSCPGLCAGLTSNHSQVGPPNWGAIDVVDPVAFQAGANKVGAPFTNHLPADPNHRSYTGF